MARLSAQFIRSIRQADVPAYKLAAAVGLSASKLSRFMRGALPVPDRRYAKQRSQLLQVAELVGVARGEAIVEADASGEASRG